LIRKLTIEGFKSIRRLEDFPLGPVNVLIGANGAGKSNFITFFRLVREMLRQRLQLALATMEGGADACLYLGPKITQEFSGKLDFGQAGYEFTLVPTTDNRLVFSDEATTRSRYRRGVERKALGSGHTEARQPLDSDLTWVVYHFHDTGIEASARRLHEINDNLALRPGAENLAAFLYTIQATSPAAYQRIRDVVRLAAPFFDDFHLRPMPANPDMIQLEWRQRGSDYPFRAHQLSDGTLRFICLATALLQPDRPSTILLDEPELGLHPYALTLLANLLRQESRQVVISTQSAQLVNEFVPEDVIIVERQNGESTFRRLNSADLSEWLQDYSLGELWQKNVLGGRPEAVSGQA
jgi:predicted ATPase